MVETAMVETAMVETAMVETPRVEAAMDFSETLEQRLLRDNCRTFFMRRYQAAEARRVQLANDALPSGLWDEVAAMGWLGCALPEAVGGGDCTLVEAVIVAEEMGRALLPGAFIDTVVGAKLLLEAAAPLDRTSLIADLAAGAATIAMAIEEGQWPLAAEDIATSIGLRAIRTGEGFVLDGSKSPVLHADKADWLLLAARTASADAGAATVSGEISLFLVAGDTPGIRHEALPSDSGEKAFAVTFPGITIPADALIGELHQGWPLLARAAQRGAILSAAMLLGACERVLEITLEHARNRKQFGKPIGSLQAIQHRCADMAIDIAVARDLTYKAAWSDARTPDDRFDASAAKCWSSDAAERVLNSAVRIHGAMGLTDECDVSLYFRHCLALRRSWGGADLHADALAAAVIR